MKKITILYSGGLDSLIMYHLANVSGYIVRGLWYDIGQPYNEKELAALPSFVERRTLEWLTPLTGNNSVPSIEGIKGKGNETGQIYIPGRNAVLVTAAACMTLADEVWLGALLGETHPAATDKNDEFKSKISSLLEYTLKPFRQDAPSPFQVRFPLAEAGFNKLTSVAWALQTGLAKEKILATSSCLSGEPGNCGHCVVCFRRWGIFSQLGISEKYNVTPLEQASNLKILDEMFKFEDSYYDDHRKAEILPALNEDFVDSRYTASEKSRWLSFKHNADYNLRQYLP